MGNILHQWFWHSRNIFSSYFPQIFCLQSLYKCKAFYNLPQVLHFDQQMSRWKFFFSLVSCRILRHVLSHQNSQQVLSRQNHPHLVRGLQLSTLVLIMSLKRKVTPQLVLLLQDQQRLLMKINLQTFSMSTNLRSVASKFLWTEKYCQATLAAKCIKLSFCMMDLHNKMKFVREWDHLLGIVANYVCMQSSYL